jgi:hypothetical protein
MQCKAIPTLPILQFLARHKGEWCYLYHATGAGFEKNVVHAMPPDTPYKLALAKMNQLLRSGLVDGCGCGCRGDWEITDKGMERVKQEDNNDATP